MKPVVRKFEERIIRALGVGCWPKGEAQAAPLSVSFREIKRLNLKRQWRHRSRSYLISDNSKYGE
jgi:hypothetical protein